MSGIGSFTDGPLLAQRHLGNRVTNWVEKRRAGDACPESLTLNHYTAVDLALIHQPSTPPKIRCATIVIALRAISNHGKIAVRP